MLTKEEAKKYLSDVAPAQCFWVNNGRILKNLEDLATVLPDIPDDTFNHHVNKEKNDFSAWINDVIGDKKLAKELSRTINKNSAFKKLIDRLNSLKRRAG